MRVHDEYTSEDYTVNEGWLRIFCAPLPDDSCGLILFQHHYRDAPEHLEQLEEANIGLISGGSYEGALKRMSMGGESAPYPSAYRRLNRLMMSGALNEQIKDTLAERGLLRAVAINDHKNKSDDVRLGIFDRAGWRKEKRGETTVRVLDLE